jgi:hypothetical protein
MIKRIYLTLIGLCGLSLWLSAQSKVSGKVVDRDTGEPLPFVSVNVKGKAYGTITNGEGVFEVYVEKINNQDSLVISLMGYQSYATDLKSATDHHLQVLLTLRPIMLETVVINARDSDAKVILSKAFENVSQNFPLDPYIYKGFLRETWSQNDKTVSLVEAVVDVNDDGYKPNRKNTVRIREKVDLKSVRATRNYMDTTFRHIGELYNTLASALRWNQIKYPHPDVVGNVKTKDCTLDDIVYLNGEPMWVISFVSNSKQNKFFERKDVFYIKRKNFAIKKHESKEYSREGKYRNQPWALPDSTFLYKAKDVTTVYEFEEYNGKMYLKYFNEQGAADVYNTQSKSVAFEVEGTVTFVVTEIETNARKAQLSNTMDHDKSLILQTTQYNTDFWNNNQVKLVPLTSKQLKDLEWEMPLVKQFAEVQSVPKSKNSKK